MGTISFSPRAEDIWYVAGWVFRQILDDVSQHYADDQRLAETFEDAKMYSSFNSLPIGTILCVPN
jgi:hypothetical protein